LDVGDAQQPEGREEGIIVCFRGGEIDPTAGGRGGEVDWATAGKATGVNWPPAGEAPTAGEVKALT
jgi:hypothetical protein